jgi:hypothetical protein
VLFTYRNATEYNKKAEARQAKARQDVVKRRRSSLVYKDNLKRQEALDHQMKIKFASDRISRKLQLAMEGKDTLEEEEEGKDDDDWKMPARNEKRNADVPKKPMKRQPSRAASSPATSPQRSSKSQPARAVSSPVASLKKQCPKRAKNRQPPRAASSPVASTKKPPHALRLRQKQKPTRIPRQSPRRSLRRTLLLPYLTTTCKSLLVY